MSIEIERRFLLRELPAGWIEQARAVPIQQGYLIIESNRILRIRDKGNGCMMTVKSGAGMTRHEEEQSIPRELFTMLWPLTEGRRNEKTRYIREHSGLLFEIDVFEADLAPMIVLEVEFDDEVSAHAFVPPEWAGREVTEDERYNNASLALHGLPEGWDRD